MEIRLKRDFGVYPNSVEGRRQGEWILMDYVDFIVHVFSAEKRAFYGLERLRKSATTISVDELNAELKAQIATTRKRATKVDAEVAKGPAQETKVQSRNAKKMVKDSIAAGTVKSKASAKPVKPAKQATKK